MFFYAVPLNASLNSQISMFLMGKPNFIGNSGKALLVIALNKTLMWSKYLSVVPFHKFYQASFKSMVLTIFSSLQQATFLKDFPKGLQLITTWILFFSYSFNSCLTESKLWPEPWIDIFKKISFKISSMSITHTLGSLR